MNTKLRYERPRLIDMTGPDFCGEFNSCGSGGGVGPGLSCLEFTSCVSGTYAERCQSGSKACGCDSCCQSGSGYNTTSGFPYVSGCECKYGSQAALNCNSGGYTGGPCIDGSMAGDNICMGGTSVYYGMGTQWCGTGE